MKNKEYKCEIKLYIPIDEANLIEKIAEKEKKSKGEILLNFLNNSPQWAEKIKKWKQFSEEVI
jgi:hypothetical protein